MVFYSPCKDYGGKVTECLTPLGARAEADETAWGADIGALSGGGSMASNAEIVVRKQALFILVGYLPNDYPTSSSPDPQWEAMIGRRYKDGDQYWTSATGEPGTTEQVVAWTRGGTGTTCAYLAHWLLWALGCRDWETVNREDDVWNGALYDAGRGSEAIHAIPRLGPSKLRYDHPAGSRSTTGATSKKSPLWVTPKVGSLPDLGDIVLIHDSSSGDHHIFVFLGLSADGKAWLTAEAGQTSLKGITPGCASRFKLRKPNMSGGVLTFDGDTKRTAQGWLSLRILLRKHLMGWNIPSAPVPTLSSGVAAGATVSGYPPSANDKNWDTGVWSELSRLLIYEFADMCFESDAVYDALWEQAPKAVWNLASELWEKAGYPDPWSYYVGATGLGLSPEQQRQRSLAVVEAQARFSRSRAGSRPEAAVTLNSAAMRAQLSTLKVALSQRASEHLDLSGIVEDAPAILSLGADLER